MVTVVQNCIIMLVGFAALLFLGYNAHLIAKFSIPPLLLGLQSQKCGGGCGGGGDSRGEPLKQAIFTSDVVEPLQQGNVIAKEKDSRGDQPSQAIFTSDGEEPLQLESDEAVEPTQQWTDENSNRGIDDNSNSRHSSVVNMKTYKEYKSKRRLCTMDTCFNKSRCRSLTVFLYNQTLKNPTECFRNGFCLPVLRHMRPGDVIPTASDGHTWRITDNPTEACLFVVVGELATSQWGKQRLHALKTGNRSIFNAAGAPGMNHVYLNMIDLPWFAYFYPCLIQAWPAASFEGRQRYQRENFGKESIHRLGFDVAFPCIPQSITNPWMCMNANESDTSRRGASCVYHNITTPRHQKNTLASFLGSVRTAPRVRAPILELHSPEVGIIAADTSPYDPHFKDEYAIKGNIDLNKTRKSLNRTLNEQIVQDSKFILAVTGRGRGASFRLVDALSVGAVPVYIGETMEPPFSETLRWSDYAMYVKFEGPNTPAVKDLPATLKRKTIGCSGSGSCEYERLQANAMWVYEHYYASDVRAIAGLLEVFGRRIRGLKEPVRLVEGRFKTAPGFCSRMLEIEKRLHARGLQPPLVDRSRCS